MTRAVAVARMQLLNRWTFLGVPVIIIVASSLLTIGIWSVVSSNENLYSGSGQAVMWYFLALGIQSMAYTFPFSQAMSVSRRTFYIGTVGLFAVVAAAVSAAYLVLSALERATNGWGMNGHMFALPWIEAAPLIVEFLFYFLAMVLLFMIGFLAATIYKRWGTFGLLITGICFAVLVLGLLASIGWTDNWPAVGEWMMAQTPLSVSGIMAVICALLGIGSYGALRKATP